MQPEFPYWWDTSADVSRIRDSSEDEDDGISCGMLRMGAQCGNDAYLVVAYDRPHNAPAFLAVCQTCCEETGLTGEETTTYWRAKQREWGVR